MRRASLRYLLAILMAMPFAVAAEQAPQTTSAKAMFIKPVALRGTLGDAQIQVNLRTKEEFEDGVEGEYFIFGRSQNVLLAGEIEGNELLLEESENGTDVSGQWAGTLSGDTISGEWQAVDGAVTKPFQLKILAIAGREQSTASKSVRNTNHR